MVPARKELEKVIFEIEPKLFVSLYLVERTPFAFGNDVIGYKRWKIDLGSRIDVDPNAICINGSAALGISLNPAKHPKDFDVTSDFDVAAVSNYHFELAWAFLRTQKRLMSTNISELGKASIKEHQKRYVFEGIIDTREILQYLPFGVSWIPALDHMSKLWPASGRDVRIRLYRDHAALTAALERSILSMQEILTRKSK